MLEFTFVQSVKILNGAGSINKIGELLNTAGYKKPLIVCGNSVKKNGTLDKIYASFKEYGIKSVVYNKVLPDPPAEIVDEGARISKENGCDCVIGLGGGSSIDTAKGINVLRFNEGSILNYAAKPMKHCTGLIAIPTTSGTGSELSNGAIVSDTVNNLKMPIMCIENMPEYAILDPELTVSMPKKLTLLTGLDTFSHCYEAYTSKLSNPLSDIVCEKLLEIIVTYLPKALENPEDIEAREKLQCASALGGFMLYNACAHVGHSIAHVIGAKLHIIHGAACAYGTPSVLKAISPVVPEKVKKIGTILGAKFTGNESEAEIGEKSAEAYRKFTDSIGLEKIEKFELDSKEFSDIAQAIVKEAFAPLSPVTIDKELAEKMLAETLGI